MKTVKLTFHGGGRTVTGSNFLLETETQKILIDCGLLQGEAAEKEDTGEKPFPYDPRSIDILFVTHAHLDHAGRIPVLVRDGFHGTIYSTPPTKDIAEVILADGIHVAASHQHNGNDGKKETPLSYDEADVRTAMELWKTLPYHEPLDLKDGMRVMFWDSGHILGSAMIEIAYGEKKMLVTGDLGNSPAPLLHDTEIVPDVNYLVMESVYGDRNHEGVTERKEKFKDVIEDTIAKKGVLVIPAFSIERTQELLFELNEFVEHRIILPIPVFVDSPLAIKVTEIYKHYENYFNANARHIIKSGDDIFQFPNLCFTFGARESIGIKKVPVPKVIIAGSGMSNGGRVVYHERNYLSDPSTTLLLVGFQAVGTPGRALATGEKTISILGERVSVRARVENIRGYSAHKDSDGLFGFVEAMGDSLEKIFVVQGEPKSALFLVQRLRDNLGSNAVSPEDNKMIELEF